MSRSKISLRRIRPFFVPQGFQTIGRLSPNRFHKGKPAAYQPLLTSWGAGCRFTRSPRRRGLRGFCAASLFSQDPRALFAEAAWPLPCSQRARRRTTLVVEPVIEYLSQRNRARTKPRPVLYSVPLGLRPLSYG